MRVAVARRSGETRVVLSGPDGARVLPFHTLAEAFAAGVLDDPSRFDGEPIASDEDLDLAPVVMGAGKVLCVGHNYRQHILEMGHGLPDYPNVFSKFNDALVGPNDPIALSDDATLWDWEAELALVIRKPAHRISTDVAEEFIAGYTVANDISARDWQRRSSQWLLGKTFERTTPVGPWLVTSDELDLSAGLTITCHVDGVEKQRSSTADLLFGPAYLVAYLSQVITLQPGDVILTGTPGGVGAAREPQERLTPGQVVTTEISGIGRLHNVCVAPEYTSSDN